VIFLKIFIAGPRLIKNLDEAVEKRLNGICTNNYDVLIGDADGVDKAVQSYYASLNYQNVTVYASNGNVRSNVGNWSVETVPVSDNCVGFDFYAAKDIVMAESSDYGFMIWNGESRGTLTNIVNLLIREKEVLVYFTPQKTFYTINSNEKLDMLLSICNKKTQRLYNKITLNHSYALSQLSLFENV